MTHRSLWTRAVPMSALLVASMVGSGVMGFMVLALVLPDLLAVLGAGVLGGAGAFAITKKVSRESRAYERQVWGLEERPG